MPPRSRTSAGLIAYRQLGTEADVFLVHPGGPFWATKDDGAWSIPKGEYEPPEDALHAARREFLEETGFTLDGPFTALTPVKLPSGKIISAWAVSADLDPERAHSNSFLMEWPPKSGHMQSFPEVDRAAWFSLTAARSKLSPGQRPLVDQLVNDVLRHLKNSAV
jgi:predicted NUDIX family NTP pyrophosphohydrolase